MAPYYSVMENHNINSFYCNQGMQSRDSCVQREQAPALRYCIQEP